MKTAVVNIRMKPETKAEAEDLFSGFGITLSDAFNLFVHQSLIERVPNAEFRAALEEAGAIRNGTIPKPPSQSVDGFFAEMRAHADLFG